MADVDSIPKTYREAVLTLAEWHGADQQEPVEIYTFPDPDEQTVRLIEVSDGNPRIGKVMPVEIGRSNEFPFRSATALLTPDEWQAVTRGEITLPSGWDLDGAERVWPR